jgi:hypothetical protein
MTKLKRIMVSVAIAAGVLALTTAPQAAAAPKEGPGTAVSSIKGVKLIPAHPRGATKKQTNQVNGQVAEAEAYLVQSVLSGRCLDADLNTINNNGTRVQLWDCDPYAAQQAFYITEIPEGYLRFQNVASGRYLDADLASINTNNTRIQLWDYVGGATNQWWATTVIPEGYLRFQSPASGRYLTAEGSVGSNGTRVQLWDYIPGGHSQWWN